jgi:hypothetical protein
MTRRRAWRRATRQGLAALGLNALALATAAVAGDFHVDAEPNGATIMRRPCESGACCNACHAGQPAFDRKPPKHDAALYGKYLVQLTEGKQLRVGPDAHITREKGTLVLYEGDKRTVLPTSGFILKDDGNRAVVVLTEGVTGPR